MPSPAEIVASKRPGKTVIGWKLDGARRAELLGVLPPRYRETIADHVTLAARLAQDTPLPDAVSAQAIGCADDGKGVEALVVEIDGETARPGGGIYHITWSIASERQPIESNDVIADLGWRAFDEPLPLVLTPARF